MINKDIVMHGVVATLCIVVMVILSVLLPQATRGHQQFAIIVANYLFMFILVGQLAIIGLEVKRQW
jgi:hypothetical protein